MKKQKGLALMETMFILMAVIGLSVNAAKAINEPDEQQTDSVVAASVSDEEINQ